MGFWVARVIVHYQKAVPTGKVLSDFRNSIDGTNPRKVFLLSRPSCCTVRSLAVSFIFTCKGSDVSSFIDEGKS